MPLHDNLLISFLFLYGTSTIPLTFFLLRAGIIEVDVSGGDVQLARNDIHQGDQLTFLRDDHLLLDRLSLLLPTARKGQKYKLILLF